MPRTRARGHCVRLGSEGNLKHSKPGEGDLKDSDPRRAPSLRNHTHKINAVAVTMLEPDPTGSQRMVPGAPASRMSTRMRDLMNDPS